MMQYTLADRLRIVFHAWQVGLTTPCADGHVLTLGEDDQGRPQLSWVVTRNGEPEGCVADVSFNYVLEQIQQMEDRTLAELAMNTVLNERHRRPLYE